MTHTTSPGFHAGWRRQIVACWIVLTFVCLHFAYAQSGQPQAAFDQYKSECYLVHTQLPRNQSELFSRHMDRVFAEYRKRFRKAGLHAASTEPMSLYLFRSQQDYLQFMAAQDIDATNTGGMFVVRSGPGRDTFQALATFVQGRSVTETFAVLQHEGFHQFAWQYIGSNLPIWANEGIAQYFEDGILTRSGMVLNLASPQRVAAIKKAILNDEATPFREMVEMSEVAWARTLNANAQAGGVLYDQAWSMVLFLITADNGRYCDAFEQYLKMMAAGQTSAAAFRRAFRSEDVEPFERRWRQFVHTLEPDPVTVVVSRLQFLGQALRYLHEQNMRMPTDLPQLRNALQKINFRAVRTVNRTSFETSASDEQVYHYAARNNTSQMFKLLPAQEKELLPRITAPMMSPTPTLVWFRDAQGQLMQDVIFE